MNGAVQATATHTVLGTPRKRAPRIGEGRPRKLATAGEFSRRAEAYFAQCYEEERRPLMTELAMAVGLTSRQALHEYKDKPEFADAVKTAMMAVEAAYEERLGGNAVAGSIFALKNMGWSDTQTIEHTGTVTHTLESSLDAARKQLEAAAEERDIIDVTP